MVAKRRGRYCILKCRWRARRDQFAGIIARIVEPVWLVAAKIVGVSLSQHRRLLTNGYFQSAAQYDAALLTLMCYRVPASTRPRLIALLHELNSMIAQIRTYLSVRDATVRNLGQFRFTKKDPVVDLELVGEEFAETDRNTVQDFFQHADGWIEFACLNLRYRRIRNARLPPQLALRQLQSRANIF